MLTYQNALIGFTMRLVAEHTQKPMTLTESGCHLFLSVKGSYVRFSPGNGAPDEFISDYTLDLEKVIAPAQKMAEHFQGLLDTSDNN